MTVHQPKTRHDTGNGADLAVRYGGSVPRYTSYPTAPHFNDDITGETYADWLAKTPADKPVSLYLHVPFCAEMCWYCGCFTKIVKRHQPVADYVTVLEKEAALVANHLPGRARASHIHWGGGSPTMLDADDWQRVMTTIDQHFDVDGDTEIAVELDPRTTKRAYVEALARVGVNRVSIGVQEFDPRIQKAINRVQPLEMTEAVVYWLRQAGIDNLNLDLMYGLPKQSVAHVEAMTRNAIQLKPQRIALFGYAHVPWMKAHQRLINEDDLPDQYQRWQSAERAAAVLVEAGYVRVGFDHFALPDDPLAAAGDDSRARNFQGYTTDTAETLIGLGASAIGSLHQGYVQNVPALKAYASAVNDGQLATTRGFALSPDDRLRRAVIDKLMCDMQVDVGALCKTSGFDAAHLDDALEKLFPMAAEGLVGFNDRRLQVNESGRALVRHVAAAFDAYLATGKGRHSSGV